jgi:hypothetical protein
LQYAASARGREHDGAHTAGGAVPDRVEHGEVGGVTVDGVVERVAADVVARFEDAVLDAARRLFVDPGYAATP